MPSRNVIKHYTEDAYYHVYNRGVEKRVIFLDETDYAVFLNLLKRHLSKARATDKRGNVYQSYYDEVELLAFCLMPNHFHLLFYLNKDTSSITEVMRKIAGSYTSYFNKKYKRVGHLFQGVFKGSKINRDDYLHHVSRYIHLNPKNYKDWSYSSYSYYTGEFSADWVSCARIMELFDNKIESYVDFVSDYEEQKSIMDELKYELADW